MPQRIVVVLVVLFFGLTTAAQAVDVHVFGTDVSVSETDPAANTVTITRTGDTLVVYDSTTAPAATDDAEAAGCTEEAGAMTVTCPMAGRALYSVTLDVGADKLTLSGIGSEFINTGGGDDTVTGGEFRDVIDGGAGIDTIDGGGGNDSIDGGADADILDGGPGDDFFWNNTGGDVFKDTGGGRDSVSYYNNTNDPNGVEVTLDGAANDGNLSEDGGVDNISDGIDHVQGSRFADELTGGGGADSLSGSDGNDVLVGNGGADSFNGGTGDDRIEARDGLADAAIDCDNSQGVHGATDVAVVDAEDPAANNCEDIRKPAAGADTGAGSTATTATVTVLEVGDTTQTTKMPDVVGKEIDAARQAVLAKVAGVDLDVVFQKGCAQKSDLEVLRQRPAKGTTLTSYQGSDVPIRLYVCVAEKNFLGDCTLDGVRQDLKELPKRQDAEVALTITRKFAKCKVDYDIKLAKQAEEAKVALEAQKARDAKAKRNAELRVGLSCPVNPVDQDLRMPVTQGYAADPSGQLGLHAVDDSNAQRGFTLPVIQAPFSSYVDLRAYDRKWRPVEATVYIDAEGVGIQQGNPGGTPRSVKLTGGYGRVKFVPQKPGKIKLCAVLETGDDQVLTYAVEIRVVAVQLNQVWTTVLGRRLKKVEGGWKDISDEPVARAAGLAENWAWFLSLFGISSKSVNQAQAETSISPAAKPKRVAAKVSLGQITLDGSLSSNPVPPIVENGTCGAQSKGLLKLVSCPVLNAKDNAALVGMSTTGEKTLALGAGGVLSHNGAQVIKNGEARLISDDGSTLIGADGGTLISDKGVGLIGADGGTLISDDGSTLIGADGGSLAPAPAKLIGPDGATLIGPDGGSLIGPDGGS